MRDPNSFYSQLAPGYDAMTEFATRLQSVSAFLARVWPEVEQPAVLDVACGTGVYALAAAERGARSVGADLCAEMLTQAQGNAKRLQLAVDWRCIPMQEMSAVLDTDFDLILCMGNSLPHLLEDGELARGLAGFKRLLKPGGKLVLQILNYTAILNRQERIVAIDRTAQIEYIRFYDFLSDSRFVHFNVLSIDQAAQECTYELSCVKLRAYQQADLRRALQVADFADCVWCGDLALTTFQPDASGTLLALATA